MAGVNSEGLMKAQFPAAIAEIIGFKVTQRGTFQVP